MTIDWISVTAVTGKSKDWFTHAFPNLRGDPHWKVSNGSLGYDMGAKHTLGIKQFKSSTRDDMGTHTIYSGSALRRIEDMYGNTPIEVLHYHVLRGDKIARLDIALDFINSGIKQRQFETAWHLGQCETRLKTATIVSSLSHSGYTFYIGSQKARKKLVRIYDKASEQGIEADWIRAEVQLMGKPATQASWEIVKAYDVKQAMAGIIKQIVNFPTIPEWNRVMSDIDTIKIGSISSDKGNTRDWIQKQVIPALAREIRLDMAYWTQFKMMLESEINAVDSEK